MNVLAESSAVLTWLLDEPRAPEIATILAGAGEIVTSCLTLIECERALQRLQIMGSPTQDLVQRRTRLLAASQGWIRVELTEECQRIARGNFPVEPIRTLDALHMATAINVRDWMGPIHLLSLDQRIRDNGQALNFPLLP